MKILSLLCFLLMPTAVCAQHGSLKGRLTAGSEPLSFATVALSGTSIGAITNDKGYYHLKNVPAGTYTILFSNIGYVTERHSVSVKPGEAISLDGNLQESSSKLSEVTVTGVSRKTELRSNPIPIAVMTRKEMDQNVNNNIIIYIS